MTIAPGAVVVDAMGGDLAPGAVLEGAAKAAEQGADVVLCGPVAELGPTELPVLESGGAVAMDQPAAIALRAVEAPSIRVAARAVAANPGTALLSAGSTGATVAAAVLELGRLTGVRRPPVAARIPRPGGGHTVLLDVGADPDPEPAALVGHAALGRGFARTMGVTNPTVGLLNIGTETGKGNALARAAAAALEGQPGFVGNVEPGALLDGSVDVVVTDGFSGNVVIKTLEAVDTTTGSDRDRAAHVLGVRGTVLVAHGSADADQIAHAIMLAAESARQGMDRLTADAFETQR